MAEPQGVCMHRVRPGSSHHHDACSVSMVALAAKTAGHRGASTARASGCKAGSCVLG